MGSFVRAVLLGSLLFSLVDCSGDHGFLGTDYNPKGDLRFTDPQSGAIILTSATQPYQVSTDAFSVGISETNFGGPYTVTMVSWQNGWSLPCFEPTQADTTDQTNVILFTSSNAKSGGRATNPCVFGDGDIESASFNDNKGHSATFYFELVGTIGGAQSSRRH